MFKIEITDTNNWLDKSKKKIVKDISNSVFKMEKLKGLIIYELHIIKDSESQKINNEYRNKDYPTDVISFSFWENSPIKTQLLGEIFLNYEKLTKQAIEYNHSIERELGFLISHGIFHLLGYDHDTIEKEKEMFGKQYEILKMCNLGSENDR